HGIPVARGLPTRSRNISRWLSVLFRYPLRFSRVSRPETVHAMKLAWNQSCMYF
ncbi:hypothetical protein LZ30DRAFT_605989, partial [Colletotrichum cereale]